MRIRRIREKTVSLTDPASPAPDSSREMTASAVAVDVETPSGRVTGYGFSSIGRYAQAGLISERFAPRLLAAEQLGGHGSAFDPAHAWAVMMARERPGGDGDRSAAVGVLDMAIWDAAAKMAGLPLWKFLADRYNGGRHLERVPLIASGGLYYPGSDLHALVDEVKGYLDLGYTRVKIKCGEGGHDVGRARIEAALGPLGQDGGRLAIDLGCLCSTSAETQEMADAYAPYALAWIEEPGHPHDFELLAALTDYYEGAIGTGENILSMSETYNLLSYGGLRAGKDLIQVDPVSAGGLVAYERIVRLAEAGDWSRAQIYPHAGHLLAFHAVAGLGLGAHEVPARPDFILGGLPQSVAVENGFASLPDTPGLGFEDVPRLWEIFRGFD